MHGCSVTAGAEVREIEPIGNWARFETTGTIWFRCDPHGEYARGPKDLVMPQLSRHYPAPART
ncbi:hypothetical protein [Herbidospora daliensis]|uniref:hypothetical protein n=1 Tax=Herbidospora daliensis TaxID=295585 RepID=UPI0007857B8C|nr:hypothetical protein [Herbidospora daliensis]